MQAACLPPLVHGVVPSAFLHTNGRSGLPDAGASSAGLLRTDYTNTQADLGTSRASRSTLPRPLMAEHVETAKSH